MPPFCAEAVPAADKDNVATAAFVKVFMASCVGRDRVNCRLETLHGSAIDECISRSSSYSESAGASVRQRTMTPSIDGPGRGRVIALMPQ
jgi:hypothetical protein